MLEHAGGYAPADLAKFHGDKSGGANLPHGGSGVPPPAPEHRIWYRQHRMHNECLVNAHAVNALAASFQTFFRERLVAYPVGQWGEIMVTDFLKQNMTTAATISVLGSRVLEINPGFVDAFWQCEKHVEGLAFGLSPWLDRQAVPARDRFRAMCLKWYEAADQEFDLDAVEPSQEPDWEPVFGSIVSRGLARWTKSFNFSPESTQGVYTLFLFG